jgi:hypothetical protein
MIAAHESAAFDRPAAEVLGPSESGKTLFNQSGRPRDLHDHVVGGGGSAVGIGDRISRRSRATVTCTVILRIRRRLEGDALRFNFRPAGQNRFRCLPGVRLTFTLTVAAYKLVRLQAAGAWM